MMTSKQVWDEMPRLREIHCGGDGIMTINEVQGWLSGEGKLVTRTIVEDAFQMAVDFTKHMKDLTRFDEDGVPYVAMPLDEAIAMDPGPQILNEKRRRR